RDALAHEAVIRGMELDRVAAEALAVEAREPRRVLVRAPRLLQHFGGPVALAEGGERRSRAARAVRGKCVLQGPVEGEKIDLLERRRLVEDLVGFEGRGHGSPPQGPVTPSATPS